MGMNISSVGASSSLEYLKKLSSAKSTTSSAVEGESSSDDVKLSKPAEQMKKLEELAKSDPAKFKETVTKISDKLSEAAQSASGEDAQRLSDMAAKFKSAADTGDMSALKPSERPSSNTNLRAISAYKQHQQVGSAFKTAMDDAMSIIDDATSGVAA